MRKRTKRIIIFFLLTPFWSAAVLLVTMNSLRNMIINQLVATWHVSVESTLLTARHLHRILKDGMGVRS